MSSRTLRGSAWAYGSVAAGQAIALIATAVLARLLTPAEFGLVALALIFTTLLDTVADLGLSSALVISRDGLAEYLGAKLEKNTSFDDLRDVARALG